MTSINITVLNSSSVLTLGLRIRFFPLYVFNIVSVPSSLSITSIGWFGCCCGADVVDLEAIVSLPSFGRILDEVGLLLSCFSFLGSMTFCFLGTALSPSVASRFLFCNGSVDLGAVELIEAVGSEASGVRATSCCSQSYTSLR